MYFRVSFPIPNTFQSLAPPNFPMIGGSSVPWKKQNVFDSNVQVFTSNFYDISKNPFVVVDEQAGLVLVGTIRIDNRDEIQRFLRLNPRDVPNDGFLLLSWFKEKGKEGFSKILGDFSGFIWSRNQQTLIAFRDHFGVRSLYFADTKEGFVIASHFPLVNALVPQHSNDSILSILISDFYQERTGTLHKAIQALLPAHLLVRTPNTQRLFRYWKPNPWESTFYPKEEQYSEHLLYEIQRAVRCRMPTSPQGFGCLASGGMDSASLIAACFESNRTPWREKNRPILYNLSTPDFNCNEAPKVQLLADHLGCSWRTSPYPLPNDTKWSANTDLLKTGVLFHPSNESYSALFSQSIDDGVTSMMVGLGGDELFGTAWVGLGETTWIDALKLGGRPFYRKLRLHLGQSPRLLGRKGSNFRVFTWLSEHTRNHIVNHLRWLLNQANQINAPSYWQRMLLFTFCTAPSLESDLNIYHHWGAYTGLNFVYPLLDLRVFQVGLNFPYHLRQKNGLDKKLLRDAMKNILPTIYLNSHKAIPYTPSFVYHLLNKRKSWVLSALNEGLIRTSGLVNESKFSKFLRTIATNQAPDLFVFQLLPLLTTEFWLRTSQAPSK
jgi:asparagine synthetase B (glutamine-hydrolysing)